MMNKFSQIRAIVLILLSLVTFNYAQGAQLKNDPISYTDIGSGKPILLIHAFPTDQQLWHTQQTGLKNKFRIITLDLWGFGKSSPVDGQAITMSAYADEVKQLMDQLHIQQAIIGGESMGGYIALAFLQKYPERVSGLILSDTQSIADSDETKAKRETSAKDILQNGTSAFIQGFMQKALSPTASNETRKYLTEILNKQSPFALASGLRGMALRPDTSSVLANSQLPILIITGDQDVLISSQQSEAMHTLAKNSKLVTIAGAGHLSNLEKSDDWNKAVLEYFGASL